MLFITTYINAQNEITGFLGIKLEDKPYVAIDKLKKRYSNVEWKFPCIHLENSRQEYIHGSGCVYRQFAAR